MTSNSIHHSCCKIESTQILPVAAYLLNRSCTVAETYGRNTCSRALFFFFFLALFFLCKKCFSGTVSRIYNLFGNLNYSRTIYWHFKFLFFSLFFPLHFPSPFCFSPSFLFLRTFLQVTMATWLSLGGVFPELGLPCSLGAFRAQSLPQSQPRTGPHMA